MRLHAHVCHIRRACCPRRRRCGACRPPRAYYWRHMHVHIAYADVQLFRLMHTNYTSQSHCNNVGGACRSGLCFSGARLAPTPRACTCVCVFHCVEARELGRRTCMPTSSRWSVPSLWYRVVCMASCASGRLCSSSVLLIERLTMAYTRVEPVACIREQCTHVPRRQSYVCTQTC